MKKGASASKWVTEEMKADGINPPNILYAEAIQNIARDVEEINSGERKSQIAIEGISPGFEGAEPVKPAPGRAIRNQQSFDQFRGELEQRLRKVLVRGVDLSYDPNMREQGALEIRGADDFRVIIGRTLDGLSTTDHEAIHILKARGLFKDSEWSTLSKEAERFWLKKYDIGERYSDLSKEEQIEEAIAEAFADFANGKRVSSSAIKSIFNKIRRFFKAVREALSASDITSVDQIFEAVDSGDVGARDGSTSTEPIVKQQRQARKANPVQDLFSEGTPPFIPDRAVWDEFSKSGQGIWGRIKGAGGAMHDKIDGARIKFQDRFLPVLRAQEAIERSTGEQLPEEVNAYLAEETFSGKVGRHLFEIDEDFTKPIVDIIAQSKGELTVDDIGDYLTARHAKERNAYIASINDEMPDGGSGMTNAQADKILKDAESGAHADDMKQIAKLVDNLRERTIDLRVDAGLMSKQDAAVWRNQYKAYVP